MQMTLQKNDRMLKNSTGLLEVNRKDNLNNNHSHSHSPL